MENQAPRSFVSALYPVAGLMLISPMIELFGTTWPLRATETVWRFGSIGLGFGNALIQITGLALAMTVAAYLGHRAVLRSLASLAIVAAFLVVAAITRFMLDFADLRTLVPAGQRDTFDAATLRALLFATLSVPVLVAMGGRGWTASRRPGTESSLASDSHIIPFRRHVRGD